jgi:hypothetical protein
VRLGAPGWAGETSGHFEHPDVNGWVNAICNMSTMVNVHA